MNDFLRHIVAVAELPATGRTVKLALSADDAAALCHELDLIALTDIAAELRLKPVGRDSLHVTGRVCGQVVQPCVVTLEPVTTIIDQPVDVTYAPAPSGRAQSEASDEDAPDVLIDGRVDVGQLAREFLVMAIPDYPRRADVPPVGEESSGSERQTPFAGLRETLDRGNRKP
jgi:uncharacterized metal-binding protein YceD (DUF177 family)